jgi:hypothetical protein
MQDIENAGRSFRLFIFASIGTCALSHAAYIEHCIASGPTKFYFNRAATIRRLDMFTQIVDNSAPAKELQSTKSTAFEWRNKYLDAVWETDRLHLPRRIREAEQLILSRERELFTDLHARAEKTALTSALYALRALRQCLRLKDGSNQDLQITFQMQERS